MAHPVQVDSSYYLKRGYLTKDRLVNYWHQLNAVLDSESRTVLEIGVGNRIVSDALKKLGLELVTLDIDLELAPDAVGSVVKMPFPEARFDMVLACEVLEHLPWGDLPSALGEIRRVTKKFAFITLPHSGYVFSFAWKIPLFPATGFCVKIPHFWKKHIFNGEHYWELGKRSYSVKRVEKEFRQAGFEIKRHAIMADDPAHYHFLLSKI